MSMIDVLKNDFRLIKRDLILITFLIFVVYLALVLKFLLPWANQYLAKQGFLPNLTNTSSLSDYYPVILSFLILFTGAVLGGAIFGFLILSEKDDDTLKVLLVSPISPRQYVNYRIILAATISFLIILFIFYVVNIQVLVFYRMLAIALGAALTAPIIMLFLIIIADGKVQGISYSKFISFAGLITIISWWIKEPAQFIFGLFPPYWISKAYWAALEGNPAWLIYLLAGIVLQASVIIALRNLFIKNVYQNI